MNYITDHYPDIVAGVLSSGSLLLLFWFLLYRPLHRKVEFYESVIVDRDYTRLLGFLYKYSHNYAKSILGRYWHVYLTRLEDALFREFDSLLDVMIMNRPNRIGRINHFFSQAEKYLNGRKAPDHYWKTIYESMERAIAQSRPGYFTSDYVESVVENLKEENGIRLWLKGTYEKFLNSGNQKKYDQANEFIDLLNKCIDEYQTKINVSDDTRKILLTHKMKLNIETTKKNRIIYGS